MHRRTFVGTLALGLLAAPLAVEGQEAGKIPRIGVLVTGPPPGEHACVLALRRGFLDLGYVEGRTHVFEIRWAEGPPEEILPRLGAELVKLGVDVIVSVTSQGLVEAKPAIASVPVAADAGMLMNAERKVKQVLLNLLSNALKFTPEGGRIEVRAILVEGGVEGIRQR